MRAAVVERYGPPDVARVVEVRNPVPGPGDVVVEVVAAAVTSGDARIRGARFPRGFAPFARAAFGFRGPRRPVLGMTFSGVVTQVGTQVAGLTIGDEVSGMSGTRMGAHAELVSVAAGRVVRKPSTVSHEDAAAILFGGTTAWHYLTTLGGVVAGSDILVIGASGAVGTNAVQLARRLGARVTGVTSSANMDLVRDLGADEVIDYTRTDLTKVVDRYDIVLDTVGVLPIAEGLRLLTDDGILALPAADLWQLLRARGRIKAGTSPERAEDMVRLLDFAAAGELVAVIDGVYDLDDIAAAYAKADTGRKVGNVIVRPSSAPPARSLPGSPRARPCPTAS